MTIGRTLNDTPSPFSIVILTSSERERDRSDPVEFLSPRAPSIDGKSEVLDNIDSSIGKNRGIGTFLRGVNLTPEGVG